MSEVVKCLTPHVFKFSLINSAIPWPTKYDLGKPFPYWYYTVPFNKAILPLCFSEGRTSFIAKKHKQ